MNKKEIKKINNEKRKPGRNGSWMDTDFSIKVKKRLIDKRMTQTQLASMLGVSVGYICQNIYGQKNDELIKEKIRVILGIKNARKIASGE